MRLSPAQKYLLKMFARANKPVRIEIAHDCYAPMRRLIAKDAVERVASGINDGWVRFRITDAGRAALERSEGSPVHKPAVDSGESGDE